jgi:hypothetical protein
MFFSLDRLMDARVIGERSDAVLRTAKSGHDAECVAAARTSIEGLHDH